MSALVILATVFVYAVAAGRSRLWRSMLEVKSHNMRHPSGSREVCESHGLDIHAGSDKL